jgi:hypothetical protein
MSGAIKAVLSPITSIISPKVPKPQTPKPVELKPAVTPTKDLAADASAEEAAKKQKRAATSGFRSTILTAGNSSLGGVQTEKKTLLGA